MIAGHPARPWQSVAERPPRPAGRGCPPRVARRFDLEALVRELLKVAFAQRRKAVILPAVEPVQEVAAERFDQLRRGHLAAALLEQIGGGEIPARGRIAGLPPHPDTAAPPPPLRHS